MRLYAGRIRQSTGQFGHGDVAVLINQFNQKGAMRIKLALATRATLGCGLGMPSLTDRNSPACPVAGESFKRNAAARPLNPSSINL